MYSRYIWHPNTFLRHLEYMTILSHLRPSPFFITTTAALILYSWTLAPDLTMAHWGGDGGELITAAVTLGIPHPPGYPTYVLLGKAVSYIPLGTVAYRFNLFSAVTIALAAGLVAQVSKQSFRLPLSPSNKLRDTEGGSPPPLQQNSHTHMNNTTVTAIAAGLTFAFTPLVWGQAIITEVYGLNVFIVALFMAALRQQRPFLLGLLWGISLTTHLTSLLLLPLALITTPQTKWGWFVAGSSLGLTPLLLLPWLAHGNSPVIWEETHTFAGWSRLISGQLYHASFLGGTLNDYMQRSWIWAKLLLEQFAGVGWWFIGVGMYRLINQPTTKSQAFPPILRTGLFPPLTSLSLVATAVLYLLYSFLYHTQDAPVLLLPALLILSIFLAVGLERWGYLALLLPLCLLMLHFHSQNLRQDQGVRPSVRQLLAQTPAEAILVTPGNETIFTLWYFHHVEEQRPDLTLVDTNLFAFPWYRARLKQQYPSIIWPTVDDINQVRLLNSQHPFCQADLSSPILVQC